MIKVLQLNLWMGRLMRLVIPAIERENPDILCLQEAFSCPGGAMRYPDKTFNSVELITELGYPNVYFSPVCTFNVDGTEVRYGNAIVSRFPIIQTETVEVNKSLSDTTLLPINSGNERNAQYARIELPSGERVSVINHHGYWEPNGMGSAVSVEKMQLVKDFAQAKPAPRVVCGDLNVIPESPAMRVWDDSFENLTAIYKLKTTLGSLSKANLKSFKGDPHVACDHILVSPDIKHANFTVLNDIISDHLGLTVELDV